MLEKGVKGYAVIDPEDRGVAFESSDLDRCKYFCRPGYVVVEAIPRKCGRNFAISFNKGNPWFQKFWRDVYFLKLHIVWSPIYVHDYGYEVIWKPGDK